MSKATRLLELPLLRVLMVGVLAGCTAQHGQSIGDLQVADAWAGATPPETSVSGGYLEIRNPGDRDDRLLSVSSDAVARIEIHEVRHEDGVMKMRRLTDGLPIPAGAAVSLQPGGLHLMMVDPKKPLAQGDVVLARLNFERSGEAEIAFQVRATSAASSGHHH